MFNFRDEAVGRYKDKLDTFARSLIWEVNRIHSVGAGLSNFTQVDGTYGVENENAALASGAAGLAFGNRIFFRKLHDVHLRQCFGCPGFERGFGF